MEVVPSTHGIAHVRQRVGSIQLDDLRLMLIPLLGRWSLCLREPKRMVAPGLCHAVKASGAFARLLMRDADEA